MLKKERIELQVLEGKVSPILPLLRTVIENGFTVKIGIVWERVLSAAEASGVNQPSICTYSKSKKIDKRTIESISFFLYCFLSPDRNRKEIGQALPLATSIKNNRIASLSAHHKRVSFFMGGSGSLRLQLKLSVE